MITDAQINSLNAVSAFASVRGCVMHFEARDTSRALVNKFHRRIALPNYQYTATLTANDKAWSVERKGRDINTVLTESLRFLLTLRKSETYSRVWSLPPREIEDEYTWEDE